MVNISARPPDVDDRAVPGAWEGNLIIGRRNATPIGTQVERATGYTMLVHLPDGYTPELVCAISVAIMSRSPAAPRWWGGLLVLVGWTVAASATGFVVGGRRDIS